MALHDLIIIQSGFQIRLYIFSNIYCSIEIISTPNPKGRCRPCSRTVHGRNLSAVYGWRTILPRMYGEHSAAYNSEKWTPREHSANSYYCCVHAAYTRQTFCRKQKSVCRVHAANKLCREHPAYSVRGKNSAAYIVRGRPNLAAYIVRCSPNFF